MAPWWLQTSPSSDKRTMMWFVRSSNVIQTNYRKRLEGLWVKGDRSSAACVENQAEQSRPFLYVDLIWAPPLLPESLTYRTFIYNSWSACYWVGVKLNSNYIFHSGSDQRKQTVGVIVVLLEIRAEWRRNNQSFSWAISLIMFLLCCLCASKCGRFGLSCKHGKILLSWEKSRAKGDVNLKQLWETGELDYNEKAKISVIMSEEFCWVENRKWIKEKQMCEDTHTAEQRKCNFLEWYTL